MFTNFKVIGIIHLKNLTNDFLKNLFPQKIVTDLIFSN